MSKSEQIKRIKKYEKIMRDVDQMIDEGAKADSTILREKVKALEEYYESDLWKKDFADDEAGLLPKDLKRGVLSEDGIYNLLEKWRGLHHYKKQKTKTRGVKE